MNTVHLQVEGMQCGSCVRHVTDALRPLAGVETVNVDLQRGRVEVAGATDTVSLIAALEEAGYPARPIVVETPVVSANARTGCCCG